MANIVGIAADMNHLIGKPVALTVAVVINDDKTRVFELTGTYAGGVDTYVTNGLPEDASELSVERSGFQMSTGTALVDWDANSVRIAGIPFDGKRVQVSYVYIGNDDL